MAIAGVIGLIIIYPLFRWLVAEPSVATLVSIQALIALVFYCGYYSTVPAALWRICFRRGGGPRACPSATSSPRRRSAG